MILAYQLHRSDDRHIGVSPYTLEIFEGARLSGTLYPCRVDQLLKSPPAAIRLTPLDRRILMAIQMHQKLNGHHSYFNGPDAGKVLELLLESGRAYLWGNRRPVLRRGDPVAAPLVWLTPDEQLHTGIHLPPGWELLPSRPPMAVAPDGETLHPLDTGNLPDAAWGWLALPPLPPELAPNHLRRLSERFPNARFPVPPGLHNRRLEHFTPTPALRILRATETDESDSLRLRPVFLYGDREIAPGDPGDLIRFRDGDTLVDAPRDTLGETARMREFCALGFVPCPPRAANLFDHAEEKTCYMPNPEGGLTWSLFFEEQFSRLEQSGWRLLADERARILRPHPTSHYTEFTQTGRGWLTYETGVEIEGRRINLLPIAQRFLRARRDWDFPRFQQHLSRHDLSIALPDGVLLLPGTRFLRIIENLFELFAEDALDKHERLRLNLWRAAELAEPGGWQPPDELRLSLGALQNDTPLLPLDAPSNFNGTLRPYQQTGAAWLDFLHAHRLGGILADDMGLGKTVQVIAALRHWRNQAPQSPHALIVCPASVLPNWRREIRRFAPGLRVHVLHGTDRHLPPPSEKKPHIVLTTYGLLRNDLDRHSATPPSVVVFDEAQVLKNPRAAQTRAAAELPAPVRIALSGTPVENHLGDLWSLFHVLLPGFLGGESEFRRVFRHPIERDNAPAPRSALQARIRPLLLRRTKDLVAPELPPKTEMVQTLPLGEAQADLYQTILLALRHEIHSEIKAKGFESSKLHILDALTKLRQVCCDPRLRAPQGDWKIPNDSVKIAWLRDTLPSLVEDGRRILLFSSFTSLLDLLRPELKKLRIPFVEIRGDTRDRDTPVRLFHEGKTPVFLLSLKAGGVGLNLTAADTVILFDPWWNPAAEAQAIDRAHRIGQDKPVFIYKLVTEGTVESRILDLQQRKREWARFVDSAAQDMPSLGPEDLENLLAPLALTDS